jgi:NADH-quinone oxidoreductase subunit L
MFLAVGVAAFSAGIFHLFTHAFFKALLFLGSGSVILSLHHEQDMLKMGGLRKYLPITWATMGIATLAIAGIPPFAGFFSKDEILWNSFAGDQGRILFWLVGVLVAGLTAFYMGRLMFLTFYGEERFAGTHNPHEGSHTAPKEPSGIVTGPLVILAIFSAIGGLVGLPAWLGPNRFEHFLEPSFEQAYRGGHGLHSHGLEIGLTLLVVALAAIAIWFAYRAFVRVPDLADRIATRFAAIHRLLWNKFFVDEFYDATIVWPTERVSRVLLWRVVDVGMIDGLVNGTASLMQGWSQWIRRVQSGYARVYANWILFGAVLIFLYYYLAG